MNCNSDNKSMSQGLLVQLVSKISVLKVRLVRCGFSVQQVSNIIFVQFLSLPEVDWNDLSETKTFYDAKSKYKVSSNSAQIIIRLQKSIPDLHSSQTCQYLLTVLQIKAAQFGFNLSQSSSDSNDSGSGLQRFMHRNIKRKIKNPRNKEQQQQKTIKKQQLLKQKTQKRLHLDPQFVTNKQNQQQLSFRFKNIQKQFILKFDQVQLEKQLKNIPKSQQNDDNDNDSLN